VRPWLEETLGGEMVVVSIQELSGTIGAWIPMLFQQQRTYGRKVAGAVCAGMLRRLGAV
jgi:hypothetical protein